MFEFKQDFVHFKQINPKCMLATMYNLTFTSKSHQRLSCVFYLIFITYASGHLVATLTREHLSPISWSLNKMRVLLF